MTYRILSIAASDLAAAVGYYESQYVGLGFDFLDGFESTMSRICQCPEAWKRVGNNHRRARLRRFPYGILYCYDATGIVVSGIMHLRMNPEEQQYRLGKAEGKPR
jgi:hypothetical protein